MSKVSNEFNGYANAQRIEEDDDDNSMTVVELIKYLQSIAESAPKCKNYKIMSVNMGSLTAVSSIKIDADTKSVLML